MIFGQNEDRRGDRVVSWIKRGCGRATTEITLLMMTPILPKLTSLPTTLPIEGAVRIELEEGIPIFRASNVVLTRIEELLLKQKAAPLEQAEEEELNSYEEIDDYLSFVNRTIRNLFLTQPQLES